MNSMELSGSIQNEVGSSSNGLNPFHLSLDPFSYSSDMDCDRVIVVEEDDIIDNVKGLHLGAYSNDIESDAVHSRNGSVVHREVGTGLVLSIGKSELNKAVHFNMTEHNEMTDLKNKLNNGSMRKKDVAKMTDSQLEVRTVYVGLMLICSLCFWWRYIVVNIIENVSYHRIFCVISTGFSRW